MKNKGTFVRMSCALSLLLALGVAPGLSAYAQQAGQQQPAPRTEVAAVKTAETPVEKSAEASVAKTAEASAEGEPQPLSDAQMEKVEGGGLIGKLVHAIVNVTTGHNNNNHTTNNYYGRCR